MGLIVQKYGGSSLVDADAIGRVAERIAAAADTGMRVVVVTSAMGSTTDDLFDLAHRVASTPAPRELDLLLSTGEVVSSTLLAMALRSRGREAVALSGAQAGIRTDPRHGMAKISVVEPQRIMAELAEGKVVVVAGYQGITDEMDVTTLGRGASDLSAVALAAALQADKCEVYTDVEGIYTADPRLVPKAGKLDEVGFEEMLEMSSYGAKMNPRSIELGMTYNMPILVASSFSNTPGTLIHQEAALDETVGEIRNRVRSVLTDTDVAMITLREAKDRPGVAAALFEPLAAANISIDEIVQNVGGEGVIDLSFTVKRTEIDRALEVASEAAREMGGAGVNSVSNVAKVSIVGTVMQDAPGYAAQMFRVLADHDINIEMITTSDIRITCIVDDGRVGDAARALHTAFDLDGSD